jgi:3-keto-disaccharide hydrolase
MDKLRYGLYVLFGLVAVIVGCPGLAYESATSNDTASDQTPLVQAANESLKNDILYSDDFSNPASGWKRSSTDESAFGYKDGRYYISVLVPDKAVYAFIPNSQEFGDFVVEVEAYLDELPDDGEYGLDIRDNEDTGDFYRFVLNGNRQFEFWKYIDNNWTGLFGWTKSSAIKASPGNNTIKISAIGDTFTFYVNGKKVGECIDSSLSRGEISLLAETVENSPANVGFDNLKVWVPNSTQINEM